MFSSQFNELLWDYRGPLIVLICLIGQIIGWRFWMRQLTTQAWRRLCNAAFIIFNLGWIFTIATMYVSANPTDLFWSWIGRPAIAWQLVYPLAVLPLAVMGSLGLSLFKFVFKRRNGTTPVDDFSFSEKRRDLLKIFGSASCLAVIGTTGYGVYRQGRRPALTRETMIIPNLPNSLDGFVIAHLSDLHIGLWGSQDDILRAFETVLDANGGSSPHLVAITGDLLDRSPEFAKLYLDPLKLFKDVPYGVYGVLGNHDHYTAPDGPQRITEILNGHGITILNDQRLNLPNAPISIIGLDDQGSHHSWMGTAPSLHKTDNPVLEFYKVEGPDVTAGNLVLLLNHRPEGLKQAADLGCHIYLAGHTHGGQYQAPFFSQINVAAPFYKYTSGLYHEHGCWLNVSRGLSSVGIPFRLWAWPEVTLITLKKA